MEMDEGLLLGFWLEVQVVMPFTKIEKLREKQFGEGISILFCPC